MALLYKNMDYLTRHDFIYQLPLGQYEGFMFCLYLSSNENDFGYQIKFLYTRTVLQTKIDFSQSLFCCRLPTIYPEKFIPDEYKYFPDSLTQ